MQKPDAWKIICHVISNLKKDFKLKTLPFQRIFINFGEWQSQVRTKGLNANDCHAHINIVLKKEVIDSSQK
jgi:hypothetical protein